MQPRGSSIFFYIKINLLNSNKIRKNSNRKDKIPKKEKTDMVFGLLSSVLCIE